MNVPTFSPVTIAVPFIAPSGKNLTGFRRHIRDSVADIHRSVQEWNSHHLDGLSLIKDLIRVKQDESYSVKLQECCDKLEAVCDKLDNVVENLAERARMMQITMTPQCYGGKKLYTTWPNFKFAQVTESIHDAYSREAMVKRQILEDVAHPSAESWNMLHLACWARQPFVSDNLTIALQSMLIESGQRYGSYPITFL